MICLTSVQDTLVDTVLKELADTEREMICSEGASIALVGQSCASKLCFRVVLNRIGTL